MNISSIKKSGSCRRWFRFSFNRDGRRWDELVAHIDDLLSSIYLRDVSVQYIKYIVTDTKLYGIARFNRRIYLGYAKEVFPGASSVIPITKKEVYCFIRCTSEGPSFEMGTQSIYPRTYTKDSCNSSSSNKTTLSKKRKVPPLDDEKVSNVEIVGTPDEVCTFL